MLIKLTGKILEFGKPDKCGRMFANKNLYLGKLRKRSRRACND